MHSWFSRACLSIGSSSTISVIFLLVFMNGFANAQHSPQDLQRGSQDGWYLADLGSDTHCLYPDSGTAKIAYRDSPGGRTNSTELLLFIEGGGSCNSFDTCKGSHKPKNVSGYDLGKFNSDNKLTEYLYLRTASPDPSLDPYLNPFLQKNMVMVPYCTGDAHSGTQVRTASQDGQDYYFVGRRNFKKVVDYVFAWYPHVTTIWMMGTSAGAAGSVVNFQLVRQRLRKR